jgi:DNA-binding response OmpR family regulator
MTLKHICGRRIMIVEDELMVAMLLESALLEAGCSVVGPFGHLSDAVRAAREEAMDGALMDINLAGERVFPAAEALDLRHVPFLLVSGYDEEVLPACGRHWPVCSKPFRMEHILNMLGDLLEARPQPTA